MAECTKKIVVDGVARMITPTKKLEIMQLLEPFPVIVEPPKPPPERKPLPDESDPKYEPDGEPKSESEGEQTEGNAGFGEGSGASAENNESETSETETPEPGTETGE